jgi:CheY-like chemotaxis protein
VDASSGGGKIDIGCGQRNGKATISVADHGSGIAEDLKTKIYEPFFTTKKRKGAGLGLTIVQSIVSRFGGGVNFRGNKPTGTVFTVSFPLAESVKVADNTNSEKEDSLKRRILIVDDDDEIRKVLSEILSIEGYVAEDCPDAYSAMEILEKRTYRMVITDLGMPGMSGYDLAEYIHDKYKSIDIVLLTGWGTSLKKGGKELRGVKAVLSKPFRLAQVLDLVRN